MNMKKLYVAKYLNSDNNYDCLWFVSTQEESSKVASLTLREWEGVEDDASLGDMRIVDIWPVEDALIDQVK